MRRVLEAVAIPPWITPMGAISRLVELTLEHHAARVDGADVKSR
jgi:hypothetical protein